MTISGLTLVETWSPIIWNGTASQFDPASKPSNPVADTYYDVVGSGEDANGDFIFAGDKLVCISAGATPSWEIIRGDYDRFNALPFGIDNTGSRDTKPEIQNAVNAIDAIGGGTLYLPAGTYTVAESIEVPVSVSLCGASAVQKDADGNQTGTFIRPIGDPTEPENSQFNGFTSIQVEEGSQKFVFLLNVSRGNTDTWKKASPGTRTKVQHLIMDFTGMGEGQVQSGFWFAGSYTFSAIRAIGAATLIAKPIGTYCDGIEIFDIQAKLRADSTSWLIHLPGYGDGYTIDYVAPRYVESGTDLTTSRGVYVGRCLGGKISNIVNGVDKIEGGQNITYSNAHKEGGGLILDGADVTVENCWFSVGEEIVTQNLQIPITLFNTYHDSKGKNSSNRVTINDCDFSHTLGSTSGGVAGWPDAELLDIDIRSKAVEVVLNGGNRRVVQFAEDLNRRLMHAPLIGNSLTGVFEEWRNFSPMLATQGTQIFNQHVSVTGHMDARSEAWPVPSEKNFEFTSSPSMAGTYYYLVRPLYDPVRLIGRTPVGPDEELAITIADDNWLPGFTVDQTVASTRRPVLWEIYRGAQSGLYDKRVLVPGIDLEYFIDSGSCLNGFKWTDHAIGGVPQPAISINPNGYEGPSEYIDGGLRILDAARFAEPNAGDWQQGDVIFTPSSVPSSGKKLTSRTCRVSGSNGTWDAQYVPTS